MDLPLTLLGAPVDIGALLKPVTRSPGAEPQDRDDTRGRRGGRGGGGGGGGGARGRVKREE